MRISDWSSDVCSSDLPAMAAAVERAPVRVIAHGGECSFQFDPIGKNTFDRTSCDIAKSYLAKNGVNYANVEAPAGTTASVRIGERTIAVPEIGRASCRERVGQSV